MKQKNFGRHWQIQFYWNGVNISQTFVRVKITRTTKRGGGIEENGIFKIEKQQGICLPIDMKT